MAVQTLLATAEDLWQMPEHGGRVELVRGEIIEMSPGGHFHGRVGARVLIYVGDFVLEHRMGEVYTAETGFILARAPDTVRTPDVAFVSGGRASAQGRDEGFFVGPPDLAVEVVSPGDTSEEVMEKVEDYLDAGTSLVWVFYPRRKRVYVHRLDRDVRVLREDETLAGEDVLPGFSLSLAKIFDY